VAVQKTEEAMMRRGWLGLAALTIFAAGFLLGNASRGTTIAHAQAKNRVFELRTYTAADGKLGDLEARFRNHTVDIFKRHGMTNIGYWVPQDAPASQNTLIYILAHESRDAAAKSWDAFRADPEWKKVQSESEANGKLVSKVDSIFMDPADFSAIK
jgi:hypothetical protein